MLRQKSIENRLISYTRQLQKLKESQAVLGVHTPPYILIQIEDLEKKINELETTPDGLTNYEDVTTNPSTKHISEILNQSGFFDAPKFTGQIIRPKLISTLHKLVRSHPIVTVEGLSGSGKSHLVASYAESTYIHEENISTIWYDPQTDDTLDDLFAHIEVGVELTASSAPAKCKEFLHILRSQKAILIIDNFEQVDKNSYAVLINMASRYGVPASIILISRIYIDSIRSSSHIGHLDVQGFNLSEMRMLLKSRGLCDIENSTIQDLIDKTEGLPLAASFFSTLILDFGRRASDLLAGEILSSVRLHNWFNDICTQIGERETKLLHFLSICDTAFNMGVVRMACRQEKIEARDTVFENLQRAYLVQRYTTYRWNVHRLIAMFIQSRLEPDDKKAKHIAFARHCLRGFNPRKKLILEETEFIWKIRACKHFQSAKEYRESANILRSVTKTVKARGHYEKFMQLSAIELRENHNRNSWLDYDYAHCCLILGRLKQSLEVLEPLLYATSRQSESKRLAVARLYAEVLGAMGKHQLALEKLRETMKRLDLNSSHKTVVSHAKSVEIWLLTKLEHYSRANDLCQVVLAKDIRSNNRRGGAVILTRWGIIHQLSGSPTTAYEKFDRAIRLFRECKDLRGLAWSLSNLALSELELNRPGEAIKHLQEALQIKSNISECSVDYFDLLRNLRNRISDEKTIQLVDAELERLHSALSDIM